MYIFFFLTLLLSFNTLKCAQTPSMFYSYYFLILGDVKVSFPEVLTCTFYCLGHTDTLNATVALVFIYLFWETTESGWFSRLNLTLFVVLVHDVVRRSDVTVSVAASADVRIVLFCILKMNLCSVYIRSDHAHDEMMFLFVGAPQ